MRDLQRILSAVQRNKSISAKDISVSTAWIEGQAPQVVRTLAVLLLRRVQQGLPTGSRTGRDDDGNPPLVDRSVRLDRACQAVLLFSDAWEIGALGFGCAFIVILLFVLFHGPVITDRVAVNSFAPVCGLRSAI